MGDPSAFYERDGDGFVATELTRGPWDDRAQHGGPPAALLGGAIEALGEDAEEFLVTRVTIELLRPVPIDRLVVEATMSRAGRRAQRIDAQLLCNGELLARAAGLRLRRQNLTLPTPLTHPAPPPRAPQECDVPFEFPFFLSEIGYHTAVEVRIAEGTWGRGPCTAWVRMRYPLVAGEEPTALQRVLTAADAGNGICPALDIRDYAFPNADISVYLHRHPAGDWVGLAARSIPEPTGVGLAQCEVHDRSGEIGRCLQSLVITPGA